MRLTVNRVIATMYQIMSQRIYELGEPLAKRSIHRARRVSDTAQIPAFAFLRIQSPSWYRSEQRLRLDHAIWILTGTRSESRDIW